MVPIFLLFPPVDDPKRKKKRKKPDYLGSPQVELQMGRIRVALEERLRSDLSVDEAVNSGSLGAPGARNPPNGLGVTKMFFGFPVSTVPNIEASKLWDQVFRFSVSLVRVLCWRLLHSAAVLRTL